MKITKDLKKLLIEYTIDHPKKFQDFIDWEKFVCEDIISNLCLNKNPAAIKLLEKKLSSININWKFLSANPSAIHILEQNQLDVDWNWLCCNAAAMSLIKENPISWNDLSFNPSAIHLLEQNPTKINWSHLSSNFRAIHLIEQKLANPNECNQIDWNYLSLNASPVAIRLLEKNPMRINWMLLSKNPYAINLLKKNLKKIDWSYLSENPSLSAIDLLRRYPDRITINILRNPNVFITDKFKLNKFINKYYIK